MSCTTSAGRRAAPRRARGWLGAGIALLLLAAAPLAAQEANPAREIVESQRRLEQIRRERAQLQTEMQSIRSRVHDISSEIENLERQAAASAELLRELDFQLAQHQEHIRLSTRSLLTTQDRLAEGRAVLNRRLRDIYKRGALRTAEVLLTARSFSDLINRYKYLFLVARRDRTLVREVASLEQQMQARERALRRSLWDLESVLEQKASEHAQLEALQVQQRRLLSGVRSRERTTAQRMEQLERDEIQLRNLIETLERRRREAERLAAERRRRAAGGGMPPPAAGAGLTTRDLGRLSWPVDGRVLYRFGRVTQPNGTVLRFNGIGIGAPSGTRVLAIAEGTVVMAAPFEGYGPSVVLSHGGGYYSLYLYLKDIEVREGETVAREQPIGTVGGEQTPEGAHIEFQIRAPGGQAVDPLEWLRKRGPG